MDKEIKDLLQLQLKELKNIKTAVFCIVGVIFLGIGLAAIAMMAFGLS